MVFHQMLKKERLKRALSQQELAEEIGTTPPNVSRWERGLTFPTPYYRQKLCKFFDIEPQVLFQEITTSHPPSKGNNTCYWRVSRRGSQHQLLGRAELAKPG